MLGLLVQTLTSLPPLVYVAVGLASLLYLKTRNGTHANIPPFPVTPYPIVGHLPMLRNGLSPSLINSWADSTGDIFSLYLGSKICVIMNSLEVIKDAFVKKANYFSDRPPSFLLEEDKKIGGRGIIATSGPVWKEQRSVSIAILREFGMGKNWLAEKISDEVKCYLDTLAESKGEPLDARLLTNMAVSNVICAILIGNRFELDDPYFTRLIHLITLQFALSNGFSPARSFPFLKYLPGDLFNLKLMKKNRVEIVEHFSQRFVKERVSGDGKNSPDCFINAYYNEMRKKKQAGQPTSLDEANLTRVVTNLFFAGSETTSTTLMWAMLFALHNPHCVDKVNQEIQEIAGDGRAPSLQDKPLMPYTNAFLMEVQRKGSIAPLALPHYCNETVEVAGYTIPKGAIIMPNLDKVLSDSRTWQDPHVFRPERFLDKEGKSFVPEELIPFSLGRRYCMGESLAKAELFLFVTGIFHRFHLKPEDPDTLPSLEGVTGLTKAPKMFKVKFEERK